VVNRRRHIDTEVGVDDGAVVAGGEHLRHLPSGARRSTSHWTIRTAGGRGTTLMG
jgi:hypothetical protein